jgi:hypothetical protein
MRQSDSAGIRPGYRQEDLPLYASAGLVIQVPGGYVDIDIIQGQLCDHNIIQAAVGAPAPIVRVYVVGTEITPVTGRALVLDLAHGLESFFYHRLFLPFSLICLIIILALPIGVSIGPKSYF